VVQVVVQYGEQTDQGSDPELVVFGWGVAVLLAGLLTLLLSWLRRRPKSFEKEYWLPLHLCPACRPRVRRARAIKMCLSKVGMYERLLEKHPYAEVKLP
jgi:hypothetical protein